MGQTLVSELRAEAYTSLPPGVLSEGPEDLCTTKLAALQDSFSYGLSQRVSKRHSAPRACQVPLKRGGHTWRCKGATPDHPRPLRPRSSLATDEIQLML